jgi:hypothetical protein
MMDLLDRHAADAEAPNICEDLVATRELRLSSIEQAVFGTMIGEVQPSQHSNLGMGPTPNVEAMFAVVAHETGDELI